MKKPVVLGILVGLVLIPLAVSALKKPPVPPPTPEYYKEIIGMEAVTAAGKYTKITETSRDASISLRWEPVYGDATFTEKQEILIFLTSPGWGIILNAIPGEIIPVYGADKQFSIEKEICYVPGHPCYDAYNIIIRDKRTGLVLAEKELIIA